jgi:spore coat protein A, manganese oxidase
MNSFIHGRISMLTRRELLKLGGLAGAGLAVPLKWLSRPKQVEAFSQSGALQKFKQALRIVGPDIPIAEKDTVTQSWWQPGVDHYTIDIGQYEDLLHPDLPNPTRLWGFGQNGNFKHLGGIIAAPRGKPVQITFRNNLPPTHIIPVDSTIMGIAGNQVNRADIHLHGGLVPWPSDGGPHAWWDPDGHHGPSFLNNQVLRPGQMVEDNEAEYYYPNNQGSRLMWYHDHVFGTTRINAYAGMASAYVIYDDYEVSLMTGHNLPGPLDPRTLYLVFQDKIFVGNDIDSQDPTWQTILPASRPGDLWYAHEYDPTRWDVNPGGLALPNPSAIPEFFGDTILVNGTVAPYVEVEQRQYRLRMLNACNARFLNPRLVLAKGPDFPDNAEPANSLGPAFIQIATEGGFLPYPVMLNGPSQHQLLMAPAERADVIVDFRGVPDGSFLLLYNDAPAPYPMGDDIDDYTPNHPDSPSSIPGFTPNTRTLLQFRVKARVGAADAPISLPQTFTPTDPFLVTQAPGLPTPIPAGVKVRRLTLNEDFDAYGRLIQYLGTDEPTGPGAFGREYLADPTEVVDAGSTEVWEIVNLTGDTHPIHFHLVNVQVLSRLAFDPSTYAGGAPDMGDETAPDLNELGWKETVRMNPGEVTRVIMRFELPVVPFTVPHSPRTGGHEYVWHCHILEHEEHDMMRPLVVRDVTSFIPFVSP